MNHFKIMKLRWRQLENILMDRKLEGLTKTRIDDYSLTDAEYQSANKKFLYTKKFLRRLCGYLCVDTKQYVSMQTIEFIKEYTAYPNKLDRILYSEISNFIFSLDLEKRGAFLTNVEVLLIDLEKDDLDVDCRKLIIKIYDHTQLAIHQVEAVNRISATTIGDAKESLRKEAKSMQKEYIAILGIFASIVLAFTAGIVFSSKVLEFMHLSSIYRIIIVTLIIGIVIINILYGLFYYIGKIVNEIYDTKIKPLVITNLIIVGLIGLTVLGWYFGVVEKRNVDVDSSIKNHSYINEKK